jgi:hypothetical protein
VEILILFGSAVRNWRSLAFLFRNVSGVSKKAGSVAIALIKAVSPAFVMLCR